MSNLLSEQKGLLAQSLLRNASKIKEERAIAILRSAERVYRRKVEDLQSSIDDLESSRQAALDLSPNDINSLVVATDFKAEDFYENDIKKTLDIRNERIKLEEAKARYKALFGDMQPSAVATA